MDAAGSKTSAVAAWLHEDGIRAITPAEKKQLAEQAGDGPGQAERYSVALGRLDSIDGQASVLPNLPFPAPPAPVMKHSQLGELWDRLGLHMFAVAYKDLCASQPLARAVRFELAPDVHVELARQKDGKELWAVRDAIGNCLTRSGDWLAEPFPSGRDEAFLEACRFESTAAAIATWQAGNPQ